MRSAARRDNGELASAALRTGGVDVPPAATPPAAGRASARSPEGFYGWRIVGASSAALVLTAPGQTAGVSALIDPMLADLSISRTGLSTAYLVGTLTGAATMPLVGRALDTYGIRRTMASSAPCSAPS